MKIVNLGSVNIDHVYQVNHFAQPGETLQADSYKVFPGGKGLNQSLALANAGVAVLHAGKVGPGAEWLIRLLQDSGVDTSLLSESARPTGHAVIQVVPSGENAIVIDGGANRDLDEGLIQRTLAALSPGDFLLLQNEVNAVGDIIRACADRPINVVFNPAPMTAAVSSYPLDRVDWFILNQVEGSAMTRQADPEGILKAMLKRYPKAKTVLTLGSKGLLYGDSQQTLPVAAESVNAIDTTGTGDTFIGFFLGAVMNNRPLNTALEEGCRAAAICATREGAASSIPKYAELAPFFA
ncbi:MAG: ribokinase [bacterium]